MYIGITTIIFLLRKEEKAIPATTRFKSDLIQKLASGAKLEELLKRREKPENRR